MFTVTFKNKQTGEQEFSKVLNSKLAALKWARHLIKTSFADSANVHSGDQHGDLIFTFENFPT